MFGIALVIMRDQYILQNIKFLSCHGELQPDAKKVNDYSDQK